MNEQDVEVAEEFIGGVRQGEREAFEQLVMLHREDLQDFIGARVPSPEDAADISQQVLLRAFLNLGSFEGRAAPSTWLLSIARRAITDLYRAHRNSPSTPATLENEALDDLSSPDRGSIPELCDARYRVKGCLACLLKFLSLHEQLAILLCDFYGFSDTESSRILGDNLGALKHLLHSARATMDFVSGASCALVRKSGTPSCCVLANVGGLISNPSAHTDPKDSHKEALLALRADLLRDIESLLHP